MLTAELTDNAGWDFLLQLAAMADETKLCDAFENARAQEAQHLVVIECWLSAMLSVKEKSPAF